MRKKILHAETVINELKGQSVFFRREPLPSSTKPESSSAYQAPDEPKLAQEPTDEQTTKVTQKSTRKSNVSRDTSSDTPRRLSRAESRELPTRDEIQEFSFHLRDALKVKVQAEVPHNWQRELEEVARELDVKKLELYRYIFGEFLGKVKRGKLIAR